MKKLFRYGIMGLFILSLFLPVTSFAVGTVTQAKANLSYYVSKITLSWVGSTVSTVGSVPSTVTTWPIDGYIFLVVTTPSVGTAPTALYDIVLNDTAGFDVMGGELANRSDTVTEQAVPKISSVYGSRFVSGKLTFVLTGNSVSAGAGTVEIYYYVDRR